MNGYLMQEQQWTPGNDLFIESFAPENRYGVVFEDDGETAYFYAVEKDQDNGLRILDALHILEAGGSEGGQEVGEREEQQEAGEFEEQQDPEGPSPATPPGPASQPAQQPADLKIIWSRDWLKCALVLDGFVHALFDFENQGGYNINEFPEPNEFWTQGDRKLTAELIQRFF